MTIALTKHQRDFLALMACKPAPCLFAWYQPARDDSGVRGALVAAYGHPDGWSHFLAGTSDGKRTMLPKAELSALHEAKLIENLHITDAGRAALDASREVV